jgi:hypothetical protein
VRAEFGRGRHCGLRYRGENGGKVVFHGGWGMERKEMIRSEIVMATGVESR